MRWFPLFLVALAAPAAAQEIVVTGDRRAQDAARFAGSAARLDAGALARIDAQVAAEALNRLPGVAIHRNNGVENLPAIRSPVLVGGQSAGSFLILEDGVPIRAPGFSNVNALFETSLDLAESVEVIRGPGSALYGSNAVHGLVNVLTPPARRDPSESDGDCWGDDARAWSLESAGVNVGSFERSSMHMLARGGFRRPGGLDCIAEDVEGTFYSTSLPTRFLAGLSLDHDGGWRDQSSVDQQHLLLGADLRRGRWDIDTRAVFQNLNQETAGFIVGAGAYRDTALARANPTPEAYRDQQLARIRTTFARRFDAVELRLTPYARWIDAQLLQSFLPSRALEETSQAGAGLQSALYWDVRSDLLLILGADADLTRGTLREFQSLPDQPNGYTQGLHYDYAVDMRAAALFAQARWAFAPDWTLNAGLRAEHVAYDYVNSAPDGDVGRFRRGPDGSDSFDALMPKLGVVWSLGAADTLYLNFARGARPPQITDLYSLQTQQTPGGQGIETTDSVELGWRAELGPIAAGVALYHMEKRDTAFRNADGFTVTGGRTRHQGVELSARAPLGDAFELAGWLSYARHTYRFADPSGRAGESILAGNDIDTAPRWLWNARATWRPLERTSLELEWTHMGRYFTNAENTRTYPGHDVLNLRAEYALDDGLTL
ncbi:MAG: TonB-dependent receptor, partial [Hyphomonadaceae bacterium]